MEEVVEVARAVGAEVVELDVHDLLVRAHARALGFDGPLRGPLRRAVDGGAPPVRSIVERVGALLPGATVVAAPRDGPVRALYRRAMSGVAGTLRLVVEGEGRWVIEVPEAPGLLVESIALAADTAMAVKRRFGDALPDLRRLAFDRSSRDLAADRHSGEAQGNLGVIHLNAAYVDASALRRLRPAGTPAREIDGLVAHELWHVIDHAFRQRRARDSMAMRQALGEHLGVATIERVVPGTAAHQRLTSEVSAYAGTKADEAMAEMFEAWWCGTRPASSLVARFGELIEELFPVSRPGG